MYIVYTTKTQYLKQFRKQQQQKAPSRLQHTHTQNKNTYENIHLQQRNNKFVYKAFREIISGSKTKQIGQH